MVADKAKTPKSSKGKPRKKSEAESTTPVETKATAPEPKAEAPAPEPEEPRFSADDWLQASKRQLGVKPWILRGALAGQPEDRKYTRTEIDKLVRQALNTPA